jgi:endoglucanase
MKDDLELYPSRLRHQGSEDERSVLGSAGEDRPRAENRKAAMAHVLAVHAARRRARGRALSLAAAALAVAATVVLVRAHVQEPRPVTVTAEPRTSAAPSTPAPSASGANPLAPCSPALVAEGKNPLIDDFEDGDMHMPMIEHRAGQWLTFNDGTGNQTPRAGEPFSAARMAGGRGASHFGVHSFGGKFTKWGAMLNVSLNPHHCYDASAYGGVEFWARGRGEIRVGVKVTQVVSEEFGGSCQHDCFDSHTKRIKLSRNFEHIVVRWEELKQTGFGEAVPFDPHSLDSIEFSVLPEQTPFDFWLDDVSFSQR